MTPEQQRLPTEFTQNLLSGNAYQMEAAMIMSELPVIFTGKGKGKRKGIRKWNAIVSSDVESSEEEEQDHQSEIQENQGENKTKDQDSEETRNAERDKMTKHKKHTH